MINNNLIALDADGVLIDYHEAYAMAWCRAFGYRPAIRDPQGHHPYHYWDVPLLDEAGRSHLATNGFTEELWASMPVLEGALDACELLQDKGFALICVTALRPSMRDARSRNLVNLGFKLDAVYAVGSRAEGNPKRKQLTLLSPLVFVDDHLPFLQDLPESVTRVLINVRPNNSPNCNPAVEQPHYEHRSLLEFAVAFAPRAG